MSRLIAWVSSCALLLLTNPTSAQSPDGEGERTEAAEGQSEAWGEAGDGAGVDPEGAAQASPGPELASADETKVHRDVPPLVWDPSLRRLRPWEYAIGPILITGAFVAYLVPPDPDLDFSAGNRFDRVLQDRISVRSSTYRRGADIVGDVGFYGSMVYRGVEDLLMVGLARGGWSVASQLVAIDAMAFGLIGAVVWGSQVFVGRQRPSAYYCERDPAYFEEFGCARYGATRSLFSGHFAAAVAGASLTCLYHDRFQIYRRPRAGNAACGSTIALAVLTGVARSTGDAHWVTDMLGGGALGFVSGWILPRVVLFGFGDEKGEPARAAEGEAPRVSLRVRPFFQGSSGGLETRGLF